MQTTISFDTSNPPIKFDQSVVELLQDKIAYEVFGHKQFEIKKDGNSYDTYSLAGIDVHNHDDWVKLVLLVGNNFSTKNENFSIILAEKKNEPV